jgi:squalene-associated FAD-dependent desaturase
LRVAIIGGGCAGLAAAATLAERNISATVFEAAKHLGGRARSLEWNGTHLDNGQHILIGAYRETLRLMRLAGVDEAHALLRLPLQLIQHKQFHLQAPSWLPAPLHVLYGLLRAQGLSYGERRAALFFMLKLRLTHFRLPHDQPLAALLTQHQQSERIIQYLWEPLCLAALNTPISHASAQVFLNVLRDSFAQSRHDSDLLLPRVALSELFAEPLANYVTSKGGAIHRETTVSAITRQDNGYMLTVRDAASHFTHVILAVPPFRLAKLVADLTPLAAVAQICESYDYQPIATIYLQYPPHVRLPHPMLGLTGEYAQWVLDRGMLNGQQGLLAVVISTEGAHMKLTQEELADRVASEIAQAFPDFPPTLWRKVIIEKRATFACTPDMPRPSQQTSCPNLYLAGDYTAGDYPATIEGAVRSGIACAQEIPAS